MKKTLLLLLPFSLYSQEYQEMIDSAGYYYENGDFLKSTFFFEQAFISNDIDYSDYYDAACANSLAGKSDKAIHYLNLAFLSGDDDFTWMYYDMDLNPIRKEKAYKTFEEKYKPDSTLFYFDLIKLLQNKNEKLVIYNKKIDLSAYDNGYFIHSGLGDYARSDILSRMNFEFGDSTLDFSNTFLLFLNCEFIISEEWANSNVLPYIKLKTLGFGQECKSNSLMLNELYTENLIFSETEFQNTHLESIFLNGAFQIDNEGDRLHLANSSLHLDSKKFDDDFGIFTRDSVFHQWISSSTAKTSLVISDCLFAGKGSKLHPFQIFSNHQTLNILNSEFEMPVYFGGSAAKQLDISESIFKDFVDFTYFVFPEFNCYMPFDQFKREFVFYANNSNLERVILGDSGNDFKNKEAFNKITDSYKRLYNNYRSRGELSSANAAYVKLKEIEIAHLQLKNRTNEETIRLRLNQIMGYYTDFGTSPGKAIIISFNIIILFAIFYFFFPSEWDKATKSRMLSDYKAFIQKNELGYKNPFFKLLKGLALSFINAIMLSINSFVTLGFGTIPTIGLPRYICVLQGLLGWFLLSLFTVALINQVLL